MSLFPAERPAMDGQAGGSLNLDCYAMDGKHYTFYTRARSSAG
ncbi:MAG: hypothetical protein OEY52_16695 [Gammaproteobacteria bacterium]|nr:hypothetical protein [Gammaproteobacteria bacterium]